MGETLASYGEPTVGRVVEQNKRPGETKTTGKQKRHKILFSNENTLRLCDSRGL